MSSTPFSRRSLLAASAALVAPHAFAAPPLPFVADYESTTGGRVGFFMANAASGRQLAWRAHERFAMCSTFKASLAALVLARVDAGQDRLDRAVTYGPADILDYAPVADFGLLRGAVEAAEQRGTDVQVGLLFSCDSFYASRPELTQRMADHGVLAIEMEASALYTLAARHGRRALAICTVSDHIVTGEETSSAEREQTFGEMVEIALAAAVG